MGLLQRCSLDWATNMPLNTLFFWALKLHGSTHLLSKGTERYFLSNSGNAKIIIGLHFVSRDNFCLGTAFGWIITSLADLNSDICGDQTESNFGKTVLHFVTRDSSSLGSAFGWICCDQTGSNYGKTVPSFDSTRLHGDQTGSRGQKVSLPFALWDKRDICGRRLGKLHHAFRTDSVLFFSSVIVKWNMSNGSFKKWKWFTRSFNRPEQ